MSDTPRTNNYVADFPGSSREPRLLDFARQLENELAEAEKKVFVYKTALELAESELIEAQAEIERKNKLIEQMREALQWYKEQVSSCNRNGDAGELARDRLAKDVGKRAEAALSAAERGE